MDLSHTKSNKNKFIEINKFFYKKFLVPECLCSTVKNWPVHT